MKEHRDYQETLQILSETIKKEPFTEEEKKLINSVVWVTKRFNNNGHGFKDAIEIVNNYYDTDITDLSKKTEFRYARQIYFYCMYAINKIFPKDSKINLQDLANSVGLKSHCTVLHGFNVIKGEMSYDKRIVSDVNSLMDELKELYIN